MHQLSCRLFAIACSLSLLFAGCKNAVISPDDAFTPYVPAFTTGHISARSPILIRIASDQQWKDSSLNAIQKAFDFDPDVEGTAYWHDQLTIGFRPAKRLEQERTYTIDFKLGSLIQVPKHLNLFKFQVTTYRQGVDVRVTDMQSLSATDLTWQRLVVAVYTSDDATGQDLDGCFHATQKGRNGDLPLTWEHEPNGRYHRFTVDSVLRSDAASLVEIGWNADRIGSEDKGSLPFDVPAIGDLTLISATTSSDGEQYATLLFSDPLDAAQDLKGIVGIAGVDDMRISLNGNKVFLYPSERLRGDHVCHVSRNVKNVNGKTLGKDVMVDLTFEELKPAVRMIGKGVILPSSSGMMMPFEAVNLSAIDVRIVRIYENNVSQFLQVNALDGERELARVGRLVARKTIPLKTADAPDLGKWNRYYLNLEKHFKAEPGAIYRVDLSFSRKHSVYPCEGASTASDEPEHEQTWEQEQTAYDQSYDHYYYDDYYYDDYDYREREDPCTPSYYANRGSVSRNLLASDLGLIAKVGNDGSMFIAVSDIRTTEPLSGVKLDVLDLQRKSMAQVITDREGLATLPASKHKPFLLIASKGTQRGYLKLDDGSSLSVSEFSVEGQSIDKGIKGMIYGERGVWRPGDSLYLGFILQDALHKLPKDHPVVLELSDPRGRLDQKQLRTTGKNGMYAFRCATSPDAPTGFWNATVTVGGTTFHKTIRIETVKPNRLKVLLDLGGERLSAGHQNKIGLRSNWLHGAPARNLKARVTVNMSNAYSAFKGYEKFQFNDLRTWVPDEEQVVFDGQLNAQGETSFQLEVETGKSAPAVMNANIVTRIFEAGGDASMDQTSIPYYPYTSYAGIKTPEIRSTWGTMYTDTTYEFVLASIDAKGDPLAGHQLKAQVYKMNYNWWWDGDIDGSTNYISSPSVDLRKEEVLTTNSKGQVILKFRIDKPEWGRFAVRVSDPSSGHASAVQVYLDWPGWEGRSRREDPEQAAVLSFNADKEKYNVGDNAVLTIPSSGSGRALVSLETGSRVIDAEWIMLKEKETRYTFPITADMAPNVYAHVTLIQPHEKTLNDLPIRLYGVIPIMVEDANTHIEPVIAMTNEIRTDVPFKVSVSEKTGETMTYTLAIVDDGLLDLTRFKTPDPWNHFYAREALGVRTFDLYDQVIGAFARQLQRVLAMGGSDDAGPLDGARANRFKPVVRYVGPFTLERGKKAEHDFTISNYVGSVRVMLVGTNGEKAYGNAEKTVPVRKPLMVLATLPRVLSPGETIDLPVNVFAMDAKVKDVRVVLEPNDMLIPIGPSERTIKFSAIGDQLVMFKFRVKEGIGVAKLKVNVSGAGESATERTEVQVRQPNLPATDVTEAVLEAGQKWQNVLKPLGVAGTNSAYLEVSSIPPVDMTRRLQYLIEYPHGCLEQTMSKAFPQLYIANVMEMPDRMAQQMRANVEGGLRRLTQFQRNDGSFNYWPGGDHYDTWTTIYAGHFLIEAERLGFAMPGNVKPNWLAFQRRAAREWNNVNADGWTRQSTQFTQAYRLYVLALAKNAELGAMNRLRDQASLDTRTKWTLAAAYARVGQNDAAKALVMNLATDVAPYTEMYWTYGSDLRDEAMIADALMSMGEMAKAAALVQRISKDLSNDSWYSTQSTCFGLMTVARFAEKGQLGKGLTYNLTMAGKSQDKFSEKAIARTDLPTPDGKATIALNNTGKNLLYVRLIRTGTPLAGDERASSNGLNISVNYETMDKKPMDVTRIDQGTDLIAVVTVTHPGIRDPYYQLALTQVFPSGWEIRNSRMEGTNITGDNFTYQDIRDDRVLTYFDLYKGRSVTYRVLLNASYTGHYYLPGANCEAMYDHSVNARSQGKWVDVVRAGEPTAGQ